MSSSTRRSEEPSTLRNIGLDALPALFDTVLDRSGTGVMVFDADLRLAYVNEVAARIGGHPADVHLGRRLGELYPQIAEQAEPMLVDALERQESVRNEELVWESPRPPHARRYWMVTYVPLRSHDDVPHVAAIYVETTQVRRAHERLRSLIDALPTFVGMCTADGVIVEANEATLAAADLHRDDLVGLPLPEAPMWRDDPAVRQRVQDSVALAQQGQASRVDLAVKVGEVQATIDFQLVPIFEHGVVTALVPSALDITARAQERDRLQALAGLSRHLNGALSTTQAARLVAAHGEDVVDASFVNVALLDAERQELRIIQTIDDEEIAARWGVLALDGIRTPFHDAIATGETIFVDRATRAAQYPEMVADTDRLGLDVTASVPLTDAAGAVFGVLGVGWSATMAVDDEVRPRIELLADLCGHALRRAQRTDAQHRFVRELQDEVLATPDPSRHLDVALTYEPAQTDIGFGGDWYDVIEIDEARTALVVGDVAGHGIPAAARMTEAKATIRAMVLTEPREAVVPAATRSLQHLRSGYVATVAVAWVDTAAETVEWRLAGHPPPVLRSPDAPARLLAGPHHPPIGMPTAPRSQAGAAFPRGSLLVLYTDGLVERHDEDLDAGLERLRALVDALPPDGTAAEARDALLRELHVADSGDDVAIVVVRNR